MATQTARSRASKAPKSAPARSGLSGRSWWRTTHSAVRSQLAAATDLPTFLAGAGALTLADRKRLVDQALVLLNHFYVHLPLKEAMHGVAPLQRLRLLQHRLDHADEPSLESEIAFHSEMTEIFTSVRDLHTNYLLPAPFLDMAAFLPFDVEMCVENGRRIYIVAHIVQGFSHPAFRAGVEITHWSGVPIERAVEICAERHAGSNREARRANGVAGLTIRPLRRSPPPDESWVMVGYRTPDGRERELRVDWLVVPPLPSGQAADPLVATAAVQALDIETDLVNGMRKMLFAPQVVEAEAEHAHLAGPAPLQGLDSTMPGIFSAREVHTASGTFGYIRIFSFNVDDPDAFVAEFVRLARLLPQNGLIVDVRDNGGGHIHASERLLQVLAPRRIEPEPLQLVNTPLTLELCRRHAPSPFNALVPGFDLDLGPWVGSIDQSIQTGAIYSRGFPITTAESANAIGQQYHGPVVLITNARCYSATDIFAAGFQDHEIGPILGTDDNTGAGGANVWTHGLLSILFSEAAPPFAPVPGSPFQDLPHGADMRVAFRRNLRVGERAGTPLEDLGVQPDFRHHMTRADLLHGNVDLIARAGEILAGLPVRALAIQATASPDGSLAVEATTGGTDRLDVYLDGRPQTSLDVVDGANAFTLPSPAGSASVLRLDGFASGELVAARRLTL